LRFTVAWAVTRDIVIEASGRTFTAEVILETQEEQDMPVM
jgi:hypothetical protein